MYCELSYGLNTLNAHTVGGRWDGEGEDWPPAFIVYELAVKSEIANTSHPRMTTPLEVSSYRPSLLPIGCIPCVVRFQESLRFTTVLLDAFPTRFAGDIEGEKAILMSESIFSQMDVILLSLHLRV